MLNQVSELCGKAQQGDETAASELLSLFYRQIFAFFRRLTGNDADAADLTQKTFCKVWDSLPRFAARSSFSTWLHGIAYHVYADWRRRRNLTESQSLEWWESVPCDAPSPFEDVAEKDMAHRLYAAVDKLQEEARETVHLHYYQGLSLAETAEVMGVATSTVKYRLREALEKLRGITAEPHRAGSIVKERL